MPSGPASPGRRAALKALGATAIAAAVPRLSDGGLLAFGRIQETQAAPRLLVLSPAQYATLEAFTETIIPADERSPGAKAARVADYIDLLISEGDDALKLQWLGGIAELDEEAVTRFGRPFARLAQNEMDDLVGAIGRTEGAPATPVEAFFVMGKTATVHGFYTSEIGIHEDLRYKGNQMIAEFVGCHTQDGRDCPHCGQQAR